MIHELFNSKSFVKRKKEYCKNVKNNYQPTIKTKIMIKFSKIDIR